MYDTLIRLECGVCQLISSERDDCFIFVILNLRYQCNNNNDITYNVYKAMRDVPRRMTECEFLNEWKMKGKKLS